MNTLRKRRADSAGRSLLRRAVWVLARLKSGAPVQAGLLAQEFEVSLRTAYRDLDFLRDEWRVPIEFDRGRGTFFLTEPTALVAPITFSRGEVVALFLAEKILRQYSHRLLMDQWHGGLPDRIARSPAAHCRPRGLSGPGRPPRRRLPPRR